MCEIKFRGRELFSGDWVYGSISNLIDSSPAIITHAYVENKISSAHVVDSNTISQFTGIKDKNGKEIYKGDIAEVNYLGFIKYRVQIHIGEYEQDGSGGEYTGTKCFGVYAKALNPDQTDENEIRVVPEYLNETSLLSFDSVEIIGNIYENPELINS